MALSDEKKPPVIEVEGLSRGEPLIVESSLDNNNSGIRRSELNEICDGDALLLAEFASIQEDFGRPGVEVVLSFRDVYLKPDSSPVDKLLGIALVRGVIKIIRGFSKEISVSEEKIMGFLRNIALTAHCQDLRQLTDLIVNVQYFIQQGERFGCLERALTIDWNYFDLMLFLNNYRCIMNIHGPTIAGEQMKECLLWASYSESNRKISNQ